MTKKLTMQEKLVNLLTSKRFDAKPVTDAMIRRIGYTNPKSAIGNLRTRKRYDIRPEAVFGTTNTVRGYRLSTHTFL